MLGKVCRVILTICCLGFSYYALSNYLAGKLWSARFDLVMAVLLVVFIDLQYIKKKMRIGL